MFTSHTVIVYMGNLSAEKLESIQDKEADTLVLP